MRHSQRHNIGHSVVSSPSRQAWKPISSRVALSCSGQVRLGSKVNVPFPSSSDTATECTPTACNILPSMEHTQDSQVIPVIQTVTVDEVTKAGAAMVRAPLELKDPGGKNYIVMIIFTFFVSMYVFLNVCILKKLL